MTIWQTSRAMAAWVASLLAFALLTGCSDAPNAGSEGGRGKSATNVPPVDTFDTANAVLEAMAAAYQKTGSYADRGTIRFHAEQEGRTVDETDPFAIAFVRPGKLRLELYQARVVFDGSKLYAALDNLPGQVVVRDAPGALTLQSLDRSPVLAPALGQGFARHLVRLVLLLHDNPLEQVLDGAQEPELAEPGEIEGRPCYRVRIRRDDQIATLWIDQSSFTVRRIVLPPHGLIDGTAGEVQAASLVADFTAAEFDVPIAPEAFQFEVPPGAQVVKFFQPPHPADLLGKPAPEFEFVDDTGKPVDQSSLAGKVTVLEFWATQCQPCQDSLPSLDKVRRQYTDDPEVVFYAVNVDPPQTADAKLAELFAEWGVQINIARDPEQKMAAAFHIPGVPTLFVLNGQGIVQHYEMGANPRLESELPKTIDTLLAGGDTFEDQRRQYERQLRQMEESLERAEGLAGETMPAGEPIPAPTIAPRSQPKTIRLELLWTNTEVNQPGNVLPFRRSHGQPGLAVIDGGKRIVELSLDGKRAASHTPPLESVERFNALRTATDPAGNRWFAAVALMSGQQRFHLFDGQFQHLWSFPPDALQHPHGGIADVQLDDLSGSGTLRVYVGYWGEVGVQEVSLDGQRVWGNRHVPNIQKMTLTEPGEDGSRHLLCANVTNNLAVLDGQGELLTALAVPERIVGWIVGADLTGDGRNEYCALAAEKLGHNEAIGLTIEGASACPTWSYSLPDGVSRQPVEPIVTGRLSLTGPGHWLLPGPDGSIHILAADGKPLDKFNYGTPISGLTTVQIDGKPALIVATEEGVAAWSVE